MASLHEQIEKLDLPKGLPPLTPELVLMAASSLGVDLILTSPSVPEQYEVFKQGVCCGYVRVRHGGMQVCYPDAAGENIYVGPADGYGGFTDHEREAKLLFALTLIAARMQQI